MKSRVNDHSHHSTRELSEFSGSVSTGSFSITLKLTLGITLLNSSLSVRVSPILVSINTVLLNLSR